MEDVKALYFDGQSVKTACLFILNYRISANSFRGNYSFLEVGLRKLFEGGNYSREETIDFFLFA